MVFHGFQKVTLLDYPGKVACTLFTAGCNFRCPFCHNASLVTHIENTVTYSEEVVLSYLEKRKGIIDGVCITGGEPLIHTDIEDFIVKVKKMGFLVKIDTNGSSPEKLLKLINNGMVDYVAMDIKNSKEKYSLTTGIGNLDITNIEKCVDILIKSNIDYEFRTTVVSPFHTVDDIIKIAQWISPASEYYLQNFVDSGDLICNDLSCVDTKVLNLMKDAASEYIDNTQIRGI